MFRMNGISRCHGWQRACMFRPLSGILPFTALAHPCASMNGMSRCHGWQGAYFKNNDRGYSCYEDNCYKGNTMKAIIQTVAILALFLLMASQQVLSKQTSANQCSNIQLQVLGSGGPEINDGLASSSYLVWVNDKARVMIDAGGGSSLNFEKSGANFNNVQTILLTHLHVDHSAVLPIYIKGSFFIGRNAPLSVFGPAAGGDFPSTKQFVKALFSDENHVNNSAVKVSAYPYLSDFIEEQASTPYLLTAYDVITNKSANNHIWTKKINDEITVSAINVTHGAIPALAWRVDSGNCSVTFSGDTNANSNHLSVLAKNTQLLVAHNAIPEHAGKVAQYLHMMPSRIGEVAKEANVKQLLLSHFMSRSADKKQQSHKLIEKNYKGKVINATDLMKISL